MAQPLNNVPPLSPEQEPLIVKLQELVAEMEDAKDTDAARWAKADEERQAISKQLTELEEEKRAKERVDATEKATAAMLELQAQLRAPSKASLIGNGAHLVLGKSSYQPGTFIGAVFGMKDALKRGDVEASQKARAELDAIAGYEEAWGKATLGTTDATGGWVIPNAIVDDLIVPARLGDPYGQICNDVTGVTAFAVDIPFRSAARARAVVAPFGSTKENVDLAYNGYTATMYTLARIHDLSAQFVRQSQGAAERDVMSELAAAFALGTAYYTYRGSGSSEPYGLKTALTNAPATFTSSVTASDTTLAGSILTIIASLAGTLAGRGVRPNAAVLSATSYWQMVAQGTDTAGFFFAGTGGAPAIPGINNGTLVSPFGLPVIADPNLNVGVSGTTDPADDLIVGDFQSLKRYFGQSYRVDTSTEAGTRWDANLVGFRGEMEFGQDARPAVYAGNFQYQADIRA